MFVRTTAVSFSECSSRLVLLRMVYSDYVKQRILVYYRCKKNCAEIAWCLAEEGYSVTKVGIAKFLRRYKETGSISCKPGMSWESKVTASIRDTIENQMEKDGETTGKKLVKILKTEGVEASVSNVLRWSKDLGWTLKGMSYCQMICDVNKEKRLKFAQKNKEMTWWYHIYWWNNSANWNSQTDVQLQERLQTSLQTKAETPTQGPCLGRHQPSWKGRLVHFRGEDECSLVCINSKIITSSVHWGCISRWPSFCPRQRPKTLFEDCTKILWIRRH